ncbi:hypothetical protein GCM10027056_15320 [Glaciibacter psychrotolerans]
MLGLSCMIPVVLCLLIPHGVSALGQTIALPFAVMLTVSVYFLGRSTSLVWVYSIVFWGNAIVLAIGYTSRAVPGMNLVEECIIGVIASTVMGSVGIVLTQSRGRVVLLLSSVTITIVTVAHVATVSGGSVLPLALTVCGWLATTLGGWWMGHSVTRVMQRIASIGRAHTIERQASELEARRRRDARLLHDTVLATLTLLAHSGTGVNPAALREQAGDDAQLLRQLRLGGRPAPHRSGVYTLEPATESTLGTTLESVKQRFGRLGLEVDWHGSGQVLLPSTVLDSFLLALAECLENVRRHSGVTRADVTITDDDTTVRAMVTDAGVGFDLAAVDTARLGFAESVVARLRDVGGNARLFSSPNSGTTVVLEVPK